jgi:hypothetical protein
LLKRLASVGPVLALALLLTACGESSDREALEAMIQASIVETGPGSCSKFDTIRFLESTTDREGKAAIAECEEANLDPLVQQPKKVDVSGIDIKGNSATAVTAIEGSVLDGQKVRNAFVEREGRWKFDEWLGFVDLDAEHLILQMGRIGMLRADSPREADNVACWIGRMERMSDTALEDLLFGNGSVSSECIAESNAI